jgi:DNA-binding NarL/FixJ family response regulator
MISVLIVEDEPLIAEAHRTYLGRLSGFSVAGVAHTARDAMRTASEAVASEQPIDLVLLDIGLPDAAVSRWHRDCQVCGRRPIDDPSDGARAVAAHRVRQPSCLLS